MKQVSLAGFVTKILHLCSNSVNVDLHYRGAFPSTVFRIQNDLLAAFYKLTVPSKHCSPSEQSNSVHDFHFIEHLHSLQATSNAILQNKPLLCLCCHVEVFIQHIPVVPPFRDILRATLKVIPKMNWKIVIEIICVHVGSRIYGELSMQLRLQKFTYCFNTVILLHFSIAHITYIIFQYIFFTYQLIFTFHKGQDQNLKSVSHRHRIFFVGVGKGS